MKEFNTTGICIPERHYMADTSEMIEQIVCNLVEKGKYFTINRARQYGKTTTLNLLSRRLRDKYFVLWLSFEAADDYFISLFQFVTAIVLDIADILKKEQVDGEVISKWESPVEESLPLRRLGKKIADLCEGMDKEVILIIDEVDRSADNQIFLSFLSLLRDKYLKCAAGRDYTFRCVILSGVYDIKNMKLRLRKEEEHKYNSPWNIAADFTMNMSLSEKQIKTMLTEYEKEHQTGLDFSWFAKQIYAYTSGYPFLVSLLCKSMDEQTGWSKEGLQRALKQSILNRSTLFDDINKNIDLYPQLGDMFQGILLQGKSYIYTLSDNTVQLGNMFGYLKNRNGVVVINNRMFEMYLYDMYYKAEEAESPFVLESNLEKYRFVQDGCLDMDCILERFSVHYQNLYRDKKDTFFEEECRFLFLTFLKPIINGAGNYYIEAQTRNQRRMDVVVDYFGRQYIIELKIWHGEKYQEKGREQLMEYLDSMEADRGWLVTFCFLKRKEGYTGLRKYEKEGKQVTELVL